MKRFHLTIIRHGQTVANVNKFIQGHLDTELTELGAGQARALGNYLAPIVKFNKIFSSDLPRAIRTCTMIIELGCAVEGATIKLDPRLRDRSYGPYEGKPIHQLKRDAIQMGYDDNNFTEYTPDGGESMEEVQRRVDLFCRDVLWTDAKSGDEVMLVSHRATIKEFLKKFQPYSNGSILDEHIKEAANVSYSRFKIVCPEEKNRSDSLPTEATSGSDAVINIEPLVLHGTAHLDATRTSVCKCKRIDQHVLLER